MGEFLNQVKARRDSPEALAHRIALRLSTTKSNAVITEAGDDGFFYSAIATRLRLHNKIDFFQANGKQKVLTTLNILINLGKSDRSFAIVDRDFDFDCDDVIVNGHCLVTEFYSYENYFAEKDILENLGHKFFSLEPGSEHFELWSNIIDNFLRSLPTILIREHGAALWSRRNGYECVLGNFKLSHHITIEETGHLTRTDDVFDAFISVTRLDADKMPTEDHSEIVNELAGKPWRLYFRGHYFWEIFMKLLNKFRIKTDEDFRVAGRARTRTRQDINERHAIEASAAFISIPEIIELFLKRAAL